MALIYKNETNSTYLTKIIETISFQYSIKRYDKI